MGDIEQTEATDSSRTAAETSQRSGDLFPDVPRSVIPNAITILGLALGVASFHFIMTDDFRTVVVLLFICTLFDVADGFAARVLNAQSRYGVELDSLSDFCCFGVVVPVAYYQFALQETGLMGWLAIAFYSGCAAFRLARFNVLAGRPAPSWRKGFNQGVSAPGSASILLLPMILYFAGYADVRDMWLMLTIYPIVLGLLMVSTIPTVSQKQFARFYRPRYRLLLIAVFVFLIGAVIAFTWTTFLFVIAFQIVSTPIAAWYCYRRYFATTAQSSA